VFTDMQKWAEIRRRVLTGEISKRVACREYEIHWETLEKIFTHTQPPGYRRTKPRGSKIDPFVPIINEILESDKKAHRKQRHTAKKIFERLRDEHDYSGGYHAERIQQQPCRPSGNPLVWFGRISETSEQHGWNDNQITDQGNHQHHSHQESESRRRQERSRAEREQAKPADQGCLQHGRSAMLESKQHGTLARNSGTDLPNGPQRQMESVVDGSRW
jgi:hypothetical protein